MQSWGSCAFLARNSNQQQRGVFQKVAEFFQIFGAQGAVDHAVVAAHRERHAMADDDLVAIIDTGPL